MTSFLLFSFIHLPRQQLFELVPFLIHCNFRVWNCHRLEHRKKLAYQIVVSWNYMFCLRYHLHDLLIEMIPNAFLWIREFPQCMHALFFWNLIEFITLRFSFLKAGALLCSFLARHRRHHWNFKLAPGVFDGFLVLSIFQIDQFDTSQPSSIIELWFFQSPFCFFF